MAKRYNTRQIRADYSYSVEQVADLFQVDIATVRRWIRKEGLRRIPNVRPHLVHSADLKAFMEESKKKRKHVCQRHEVFCFRCQRPCLPQKGSATISSSPNGSFRFQGICSVCGTKMNRNIGGAEWSANHPLAQYLSDSDKQTELTPAVIIGTGQLNGEGAPSPAGAICDSATDRNKGQIQQQPICHDAVAEIE